MLSTREPGYDMSRLRIDKHKRDQILRTAGTAFAQAIRDRIADRHADPTSGQRPQLVSADS